MVQCFVCLLCFCLSFFSFFQAEDGIRDHCVTGVQTCALPIWLRRPPRRGRRSRVERASRPNEAALAIPHLDLATPVGGGLQIGRARVGEEGRTRWEADQ